MKKVSIILFICLFNTAYSQYGIEVYHNVELTFLEINPDARIGGLGEIDVISSPFYSNTGLYRNPALLSKHKEESGIYISYMPYLKKDFSDLNFISTGGYHALNDKNAIGLNYTLFDQGNIVFTDEFGLYTGEERIYNLYFQATYSHSLNSPISLGTSLKYIRSIYQKLYNGREGILNTFALDFGFNFDDQYNLSETSLLNTSAGVSITNFGPKITGTNQEDKFLPTKLLLGLFINPDLYINKKLRFNIELGYQAEKCLVPTPYHSISDSVFYDSNSDISSFEAIFTSFSDAPGGFEEEFNEIMHKFGSEFRLNISDDYYIALRHGRIIEHETKGNRKYQTFGLGAGYKNIMLDFKIIGFSEYSGLNGTWSLTVGYRFNLDKNL